MKIDYKNKATYFPKEQICVVSDLHIGLEDNLLDQGVSFPFNELEHLKNDLKTIFEFFDPEKIVYNGDTLHKFGGIPESVPKKLDEVIGLFNGEHVFIKGSHDTMLESLLEKRGYSLSEKYCTSDLLITHGHKALRGVEPREHDFLVIGHDHPSIEIHGEKMDCFLYQENCVNKTDVLVLPSFSPLSRGVKINDISKRDLMSPYLKNCPVDEFRIIVEVEDDVLRFPEFGKFREKT